MSSGYPNPPGVATYPTQPAAATGPPAHVPAVADEEIRIYGHTNLLYWWPVWLVGFVMALLTYMDGHVMAVVPSGTTVEQGGRVDAGGAPSDVLVTPPGQPVPPPPAGTGEPQPRLRVAASNNYGVIFIGTILLVVVITNLTLRGLASIIAIAGLIIVGLAFALFGVWDDVFRWVGGLDVRMNAGGYLALSVPLFLIWAFTVFVYDHYTYLIVTRGQIRLRKEIGEGEVAVDTHGVVLEKKRDDIFRHWILGLGSGDLQVKTGGVANMNFELPNVMWVGWKMDRIHDMIREREMAAQGAGG